MIYGSYRVTLVGLAPLRTFTDSIPAGDYRATLRVERFRPRLIPTAPASGT